MSLRDQLLAVNDIKVSPVEVPEWGCTVHVRTLSAADVAKVKNLKDPVEATVALVCYAVSDEHGGRVFKDEDAESLKLKNWNAVDRIALRAMVHNGMTGEAVEEAKKD